MFGDLRKPDFVGIGVQRAATTWLHTCLSEHPEVFMPQKKEVQFFNANLHRGTDWYCGHFANAKRDQVVGEITPAYLREADLDAITDLVPNATLFAILRDPVQRAYSAYRLFYERLYQGLTFEEAFDASGYLRDHSLYSERFKQVLERYPRSQVKVYLYDDVLRNPQATVASVFKDAGVSVDFVPPSLHRRVNQAKFPRFQAWCCAHGLNGPLTWAKETRLGQAVKTLVFARQLRKRNRTAETKFQRHLRESVFQDDIRKTAKLIGLDLGAWLPGAR